VASFARKGLLTPSEGKKYDRTQMILMELLLCLKIAYKDEDIKRLMKPITENETSALDEKTDFAELYKIIEPVLRKHRTAAAEAAVSAAGDVKEALAFSGEDDDDSIELLMVLLLLALQADTAMFIGKKLLREYFGRG
jgi:hypothetical protein